MTLLYSNSLNFPPYVSLFMQSAKVIIPTLCQSIMHCLSKVNIPPYVSIIMQANVTFLHVSASLEIQMETEPTFFCHLNLLSPHLLLLLRSFFLCLVFFLSCFLLFTLYFFSLVTFFLLFNLSEIVHVKFERQLSTREEH